MRISNKVLIIVSLSWLVLLIVFAYSDGLKEHLQTVYLIGQGGLLAFYFAFKKKTKPCMSSKTDHSSSHSS
jgi:hypothetical protein